MSETDERPPLSQWITQAGLDAFAMPSYVYTADGLLIAGNAAAEQFWKVPNAALIGAFNLVANAEALGVALVERFQRSIAEKATIAVEPVVMDISDGTVLPTGRSVGRVWMQVHFVPLRDAAGVVHYVIGLGVDVTGEVERKEAVERAQETIAAQEATIGELEAAKAEIQRQQAMIAELSTPLIDVWRGVILVPMIGGLSRDRVDGIVSRLLPAIAERQAEVTILDLTGVPEIDTGTAMQLVRIQAMVGLLGATCVLAGIRASVAQTLAELAVDLGEIRVYQTLSGALAGWIAAGREGRAGARRG